MNVTAVLLAHAQPKPPFFFSRFNFDRMRKRGNTHYCFHCGGQYGFKPGPEGEVLDSSDGAYDSMERHSAAHADAVIGNADRYGWVSDWLYAEIGPDFPYVVSVPSTWG